MNYNNIPQELRSIRQWICHKDKIPKSPLYNGNAKPTDPATWGSLEQACAAVTKYGYTGTGFVFTSDSPYCGIDIDHCIDPDTGKINPNALDIVETMDSYTEYSPSGTGLHIIYKGNLHPEWKKKAANALGEGVHLEMYQTGRYFTVTGNKYGTQSLVNERDSFAGLVQNAYMTVKGGFCEKALPEPPKTYMTALTSWALHDSEIIAIASQSNKGFPALYSGDTSSYANDKSRTDAALCAILAFYTKDAAQIDRIFRSSGLMRDKWDRKTGNTTYGALTIENALKTVSGQYDPEHYKTAARSLPERRTDKPDDEDVSEDFRIEIPLFTFDELQYYALNPIQTAAFFADCIGEYAVFVPENGCWMIWSGKRWEVDQNELKMRRLAKIFIGNCIKAVPPMIQIPEDATDEEKKAIRQQNKIYMSYKEHYQHFTYLNSRINLIKDMQDILHHSINGFDTNPYLWNCRSGTIDLRTGELRAPDHKDYITMLSPVTYAPTARSERFERFIDEITEGDRDKARYLQKALGYCLDGNPKEECFFLALGLSTRNGKGTLFGTVLHLFGDYGQTIAFDTLARKGARDGSRPTPDIARLCAARLVLANEPDKGIYFDEALLKQLTGGDPITTRALYKAPFTFIPQFRIWITANNKPNVSDTSVFESDRLKLISFDHHFSEQERDPDLKATLKQAASAVFNWLLDGYRLYQTEGLKNYTQMNDQLRQYRQDSDIIQQYINDRLIFREEILQKDAVTLKAIRCDYIIWCKIQNISPVSARTFKEELLKHKVSVFIHHKQEKVICKISDMRCIDE